MKDSLTICIPTYRRPALLAHCLASIVEADLRPCEVIIGDNGGGDAETAKVVATFDATLPISYVVHNPPLNYGGNLRAILSFAEGDWLSVMHDDDFYLPSSGERFRAAVSEGDFDFFFSDHLVCSNDGVLLQAESVQNSVRYNRSRLQRGMMQDPLEAILLSSVCMDGWFARRELVREAAIDTRWPEYLDTQYLVQFAFNSQKWFYESEPTFVYRLSADSLTGAGIKVEELFNYYAQLPAESENHIKLKNALLSKLAPVAVSRWLSQGKKHEARQCLISDHYTIPKTLRGAIKFMVQFGWAYWPKM